MTPHDSHDDTPLDKSLHEKIIDVTQDDPTISNKKMAEMFKVSERTIQRNK